MEATDTSRNCPYCNAMVRPKALFCHRCGRAVALAQQEDLEQSEVETDLSNESSPAPETQNLSVESINLNHKDNNEETETAEKNLSPIEQSENSEEPETVVAPNDFRNSLDEKDSIQTDEKDSVQTAGPPAELITVPNNSTETVKESENKPVKASSKPSRPKTPRVVRTEYVWEESSADPTWRFLLFTIGAVIFVVIIFWLARFIR